MKPLICLFALLSITACGDAQDSASAPEEATQLRDMAMSHVSRAELTTQLAEAKMTLRVVAQADPESKEAKELEAKIAKLEQQLADL